MKKLLVILMFPITAAAEVFYMPNQGGGEIVLTQRECVFDGKVHEHLRASYAWQSESTMVKGCWAVLDGNVHVLWFVGSSSDRRVYKLEDFRRRK